MNPLDFDVGDLQNIVGSLRSEDMDALKNMAASLFSSGAQEPPPAAGSAASPPPLPFDLETLTKIASLLSALQSEKSDPRCDLLYALRPMLREERQHKVDQAARMLQLLSLLPKLKALDL